MSAHVLHVLILNDANWQYCCRWHNKLMIALVLVAISRIFFYPSSFGVHSYQTWGCSCKAQGFESCVFAWNLIQFKYPDLDPDLRLSSDWGPSHWTSSWSDFFSGYGSRSSLEKSWIQIQCLLRVRIRSVSDRIRNPSRPARI